MKNLKDYLRMNDFAFDPWGASMGPFFTLCGILTKKGEEIPPEWQYSPGINPLADCEKMEIALFLEMGEEGRQAAGRFLHRLTEMLQTAGRDY